MLIHSVTPPHMLSDAPEYPEMSVKHFGGGYIEGYTTPQGFQVARLCATDPKLYLDKQYMPGGIYSQQTPK